MAASPRVGIPRNVRRQTRGLDRVAARAVRACRFVRRMPALRRRPRARRRRRPQWAARADEGRAAVRPTHKRRRGPRGEWWLWDYPSHPPQRTREPRLVEGRSDSQAQRHWSASCSQALQFRRQYPQAIEGGEGEGLTTRGHRTAVTRWIWGPRDPEVRAARRARASSARRLQRGRLGRSLAISRVQTTSSGNTAAANAAERRTDS